MASLLQVGRLSAKSLSRLAQRVSGPIAYRRCRPRQQVGCGSSRHVGMGMRRGGLLRRVDQGGHWRQLAGVELSKEREDVVLLALGVAQHGAPTILEYRGELATVEVERLQLGHQSVGRLLLADADIGKRCALGEIGSHHWPHDLFLSRLMHRKVVDDVAKHVASLFRGTGGLECREQGTHLDMILEQLVDDVYRLILSHPRPPKPSPVIASIGYSSSACNGRALSPSDPQSPPNAQKCKMHLVREQAHFSYARRSGAPPLI